MIISKKELFTIIISLILLFAISCKKNENPGANILQPDSILINTNEKPTVNFLQPDSNLIIINDTLITFIVEPYDKDGTIDSVEFYRNGTIIQTAVNSPYKFDWPISTEDNIGVYIIKAIAYDNNGAKGESEIQIEIKSFLTKWIGVYEGTSHHFISSPSLINGQVQFNTHETYKKVQVNVKKSSQTSCLDFTITYDDSIVETKNDLKFLVSGNHFSQWGAASGYGSLNINFGSTSLNYEYYQKCGILCESGIDFVLHKK